MAEVNRIQQPDLNGYPLLQFNPVYFECIYGGTKLVVFSLVGNLVGAQLNIVWQIPNLIELCTFRADENIPAVMKFAYYCTMNGSRAFLVDFLLRPKLITTNGVTERWLTFSANIKSQPNVNFFTDFKVHIIGSDSLPNSFMSSRNGALFSSRYSCQIPLLVIRPFKSGFPKIIINNEMDLFITIKMTKHSVHHLDRRVFFNEIMTLLSTPTHGNFVIKGRDRSFFVHRERVEVHPLFTNIRELSSLETELNLNSWDQVKLAKLLYDIYMPLNELLGSIGPLTYTST